MSTIEILGAAAIQAKLDAFLVKKREQVQSAIEHAVDTTYDGSQNDVAVDTGELKSTGKKEVGELQGSVSYGSDHCYYVELGTSRQPAQPFLFPNFIRAGDQLKAECQQIVGSL